MTPWHSVDGPVKNWGIDFAVSKFYFLGRSHRLDSNFGSFDHKSVNGSSIHGDEVSHQVQVNDRSVANGIQLNSAASMSI